MDELFLQMVNAFIIAGGLGFINFYILTGLGSISIEKSEKENKTMFILFFSIVNYGMYLWFYSLLSNEDPAIKAVQSIALTTVITVLVFSLVIFPVLFFWINNSINFIRVRVKKKAITHSASPFRKTFDRNNSQEVYIFNLDDRSYVSNGFMKDWSILESDKHTFSLSISKEDGVQTSFTEDIVASIMNRYDEEGIETAIYIDTDKRLIFYVAYFPTF